jgi:hypothetical protein
MTAFLVILVESFDAGTTVALQKGRHSPRHIAERQATCAELDSDNLAGV